MSRYVILTHDWPFPHFDFMLEMGGSLRTWRLLAEPGPGRSVSADALPDHRIEYLDFEGSLSGNRGCVTRWDAGEYEVQRRADGELTVTLRSGRLAGVARMECIGESLQWRFEPRSPAEPPAEPL